MLAARRRLNSLPKSIVGDIACVNSSPQVIPHRAHPRGHRRDAPAVPGQSPVYQLKAAKQRAVRCMFVDRGISGFRVEADFSTQRSLCRFAAGVVRHCSPLGARRNTGQLSRLPIPEIALFGRYRHGTWCAWPDQMVWCGARKSAARWSPAYWSSFIYRQTGAPR